MSEPPTPTLAKLSPLRLLILSPAASHSSPSLFPPLLHALTGIAPPPHLSQGGGSFAGYTSHPPLKLRTKYYEADVGIWCDEVPLPDQEGLGGDRYEGFGGVGMTGQDGLEAQAEEPATLASWKEQMLSSAAVEVRAAIGGIVVVMPFESVTVKSTVHGMTDGSGKPPSVLDGYLDLLETINELREAIEDENSEREIATVAMIQGVALKTHGSFSQNAIDVVAEKMETELAESRGVIGWEVVGWEGVVNEEDKKSESAQKHSVGNRGSKAEEIGIKRVVEALELVNWEPVLNEETAKDEERMVAGFLGEDDDFPDGFDGNFHLAAEDGIRIQSHELEREMMGLKLAMLEQEEAESPSQFETGFDGGEGIEDVQVEQLQGLMERVVAIREAGLEMAKDDREKFAKREVAKIMREMG